MQSSSKYFSNCLIILYLGIIYFTGVPETNTLNSKIKEQAFKAAFAVGIWPSWSMFAPNPIKFDSKSFVEITFSNGERKEFNVEKEPTGILAPFRKARWMKYSQDNLRNPTQRALLTPALKYFVKKHNSSTNPIVNIQLKRKWSEIHPFSDREIPPIWATPRIEKDEILISQKIERQR